MLLPYRTVSNPAMSPFKLIECDIFDIYRQSDSILPNVKLQTTHELTALIQINHINAALHSQKSFNQIHWRHTKSYQISTLSLFTDYPVMCKDMSIVPNPFA